MSDFLVARAGRGARVAGRDIVAQKAQKAQKALNAQAPKTEHLLRRVVTLFAPHKAALSVSAALVLVSAALTEHGTHAELLARAGIYADLFTQQAQVVAATP